MSRFRKEIPVLALFLLLVLLLSLVIAVENPSVTDGYAAVCRLDSG
jgi:hypothetical protein